MRHLASLFLLAAACSDSLPPTFYESEWLRPPIAVNERALYYRDQDAFFRSRIAELGFDGVLHGLIPLEKDVRDIDVRGDVIEALVDDGADDQLVRWTASGDETVSLPSGATYAGLVLSSSGTFVTASNLDSTQAVSITWWDSGGLHEIPFATTDSYVVAADATYAYVVERDVPRLVRYPLAGGEREMVADDAFTAVIRDDQLFFATMSGTLVKRSLADGSEVVLATGPLRFEMGFIVPVGDVVFWGTQRIWNGEVEDFLLPPDTGHMLALAANSRDVYWVSTLRDKPLLLGDRSDFKLHEADIHGDRPY